MPRAADAERAATFDAPHGPPQSERTRDECMGRIARAVRATYAGVPSDRAMNEAEIIALALDAIGLDRPRSDDDGDRYELRRRINKAVALVEKENRGAHAAWEARQLEAATAYA
jgi:hypothetical protein